MSSNTPLIAYRGPNKPVYQTDGSAGCDLQSLEDVVLLPGKRVLISTGLFLEIPHGFMGMICPRSGLALNHGVTVLNAPGIIDSDYRNEVKVVLINLGDEEYFVKKGDRIAQIIFSPAPQCHLHYSKDMTETLRGLRGFGSTGI